MANLSSVAPAPPSLSGVPPVPAQEPPDVEMCPDGTIISRPEVLTLSLQTGGKTVGGTVAVQSGQVLGRHGDAGGVFEKFRTVSRRHARVTFVNGVWNIEDLESTNGTWVNGRRLNTEERCPLDEGDTVALSLACEMKVLR
jgi:pSer/pThr/pTyr-binding forkhead associated (FHA) protein